MAIYTAKDLADGFRTVRKNTQIIAEEIPEAKYSYRATPDTRSVAEMLVHIALVPTVQYQIQAVEKLTTLANFDFPGFVGGLIAEEKTPRSKEHIVTMLRENGASFADWLGSLSENFLAERVSMRPGMTPASKTRFEMLLGVKEHEMHHRGQLMLIERLLGMVPHLTRDFQATMASMQSGGQAKAQG
jgi:hypothetical protein